MTTALKTSLAATFVASSQHDPRYNRKEAYDEAVTGFSESLVYFASQDLFPGQSSSFANVANAVSGKGVNTFAPGGGTAPTLVGGGMSFVSGAAGTPGLRIGVAATADIKHVSDLTNLAVGERAFFGTCFKITTAAADNFVRPIHALSDSGTVPGGKLQYMLSYSQAGLRAYVAGANVDLGIIPVVGKIYEVGIEIVPNPTGATTLNIWVYNVTDDAIVVDGAAASITYAAWLAMVNGGGMINRAYAVDGTAPLTSAVVYRAYQGVVSTTSVSPRSAEEQFFTEARLMREAYVAAKLA